MQLLSNGLILYLALQLDSLRNAFCRAKYGEFEEIDFCTLPRVVPVLRMDQADSEDPLQLPA